MRCALCVNMLAEVSLSRRCSLGATSAGFRPDARLLFVISLGSGGGGGGGGGGGEGVSGADERAPVSTSEWTVATAGRLRAIKALSQLAKVLVGGTAASGGGGAGADVSAAAAATLEAQVVRLMSAPSAAWRMTGAHLLSHWLNAIPEGSPKPPLQAPGARLGELLAATNPAYPSAPSPAAYSEVAKVVERVKTEAAGLLRAAAAAGVAPTTSEVGLVQAN